MASQWVSSGWNCLWNKSNTKTMWKQNKDPVNSARSECPLRDTLRNHHLAGAPHPGQPLNCFGSLWTRPSGRFISMGSYDTWSLCLTSFTHITFSTFIYFVAWTILYSWITFHWMYQWVFSSQLGPFRFSRNTVSFWAISCQSVPRSRGCNHTQSYCQDGALRPALFIPFLPHALLSPLLEPWLP